MLRFPSLAALAMLVLSSEPRVAQEVVLDFTAMEGRDGTAPLPGRFQVFRSQTDGHFFVAPLTVRGSWAEFTDTGELVGLFGRPWVDGAPGEFRSVSHVIPMAGDTLVVVDGARAAWVTRKGEYIAARFLPYPAFRDVFVSERTIKLLAGPRGKLLVLTLSGPEDIEKREYEYVLNDGYNEPAFIDSSKVWLHIPRRVLDLESGSYREVAGIPSDVATVYLLGPDGPIFATAWGGETFSFDGSGAQRVAWATPDHTREVMNDAGYIMRAVENVWGAVTRIEIFSVR